MKNKHIARKPKSKLTRGLRPAVSRQLVSEKFTPAISVVDSARLPLVHKEAMVYPEVVPKKPLTLEDIPLSDLQPSPEHIALVREFVEGLDRKRSLYVGILQSLERSANVTVTEFAPVASPAVVRLPARVKRTHPESEIKPLALRSGSYADTIYRILIEMNRPVPPDELKAEMAKFGFGEKLQLNRGQAFYATLQRMKQAGHVVNYNGALTTPGIKQRFIEDVAAGRAVDIRHARYRNPLAEEIYRFLQDRRAPASLAEIMEHLEPHGALGKARLQKPYVLKMLNKLISQSKSVKRVEKNVYCAVEHLENSSAPEAGAESESEIDMFRGVEADAATPRH
jgi:hypothetical protein